MNIVEYFTWLTGLEPTIPQKKLLEEAVDINNRKILITSGFQSGKSLCTAVIVMWWIFEYPEPVSVILISAQVDIVYKHIRDMFARHPELLQQLGARSQLAADLVPVHGFELQKGSIVYIRGATEKQIRGIPADIVVMDEACLIKNDIILSTIGRLTGKIAKFILLSTPDNSSSLFVEWATDKDSGFNVYKWKATIEECPWHNIEQEELKKKTYSKAQYAALVLGEPPTREERSFIPRKQVEDSFQDIEPMREGGVISRIEFGIDTAISNSTILTIRERIGTTKTKILFIKKYPKGYSIELQIDDILKLRAEWKPYIIKVDSKPQDWKEYAEKRAKGIFRFVDMTIHRENMMGQLQRVFREHKIIIPSIFTDLKKRLILFRMVKGDTAKPYESDYVDSLALAIYESESLITETPRMVFFPNRKDNDGNII